MPRVLDASAAVDLLVDDSRSPLIRAALEGHTVLAPAHVDAEVTSALRGMLLGGDLSAETAARAVDLWARAPVRRWPLPGLLSAAWGFRDTLTLYDALYVALARSLGFPLVTADRRLARFAEGVVDVVAL